MAVIKLFSQETPERRHHSRVNMSMIVHIHSWYHVRNQVLYVRVKQEVRLKLHVMHRIEKNVVNALSERGHLKPFRGRGAGRVNAHEMWSTHRPEEMTSHGSPLWCSGVLEHNENGAIPTMDVQDSFEALGGCCINLVLFRLLFKNYTRHFMEIQQQE